MIICNFFELDSGKYRFKPFDNSNNLLVLSGEYINEGNCLNALNIIRNDLLHWHIKYDAAEKIGYIYNRYNNKINVVTDSPISKDKLSSIQEYLNKYYLNIEIKKQLIQTYFV